MQESLENSHQGILVLSQQAERNFTSPSEGTFTMDVSVRVKTREYPQTNHCIRKRQRHRSCYESIGMVPPRVFQKFGLCQRDS